MLVLSDILPIIVIVLCQYLAAKNNWEIMALGHMQPLDSETDAGSHMLSYIKDTITKNDQIT
jgi:hypothetical protein